MGIQPQAPHGVIFRGLGDRDHPVGSSQNQFLKPVIGYDIACAMELRKEAHSHVVDGCCELRPSGNAAKQVGCVKHIDIAHYEIHRWIASDVEKVK